MSRLPPEIPVTSRVAVPSSEVRLAYARSGGPGGQHVNKTATKVVLRWNVASSTALGAADRAWLLARLAARLTNDGDLILAVESHRDQRRNVEEALLRFADVVRRALARPKPRTKTKPSRASRERRLDAKRRRGATKERRRPPPE